jgi:hypothetical protein
VTLRLPPGLRAETAAVWIPSLAKIVWRLRAEKAGRYTLEVESGGATLAKQVAVDGGFGRLSPRRDKPGIVPQLLYPVEAPLPRAQSVESLRIPYPAGTIAVFGHEMSWMIPFLGFLTLFACSSKDPCGSRSESSAASDRLEAAPGMPHAHTAAVERDVSETSAWRLHHDRPREARRCEPARRRCGWAPTPKRAVRSTARAAGWSSSASKRSRSRHRTATTCWRRAGGRTPGGAV